MQRDVNVVLCRAHCRPLGRSCLFGLAARAKQSLVRSIVHYASDAHLRSLEDLARL